MKTTTKKIIIIGSGYSSLAASCYLAQAGYKVQVLEKNIELGGRARQFTKQGFTFDIGPTFYWMPDVFESFFADFNKKPSDYYHLDRLNPAYQVYFGVEDSLVIADNLEEIKKTFESIEQGSAAQLQSFIDDAEINYNIAIKDLVYKPGVSPLELVTAKTVTKIHHFISTIRKEVAKKMKNPKLIKVLEFPVLFLGAKPNNTPSFYNFMNYADFKLGTWHPKGGMFQVTQGMIDLAKELGVEFVADCPITSINMENKNVTSVSTPKGNFACDILLSGADYHHTETLLPVQFRQYSEDYWNGKVFAPSAMLFYVGFDKKLENLAHHTMFFDTDFDTHAESIYDTKTYPNNPLFYASFPSMTDDSVAPKGKEAGIFLIPLAPDLEDTPQIREQYFNILLDRVEKLTNKTVRDSILFHESFCVNDFKEQYNSYKGNAYGLANTLLQTHFLRPKIKSKKVKNLYFTGQLTVPGPGVPPSLISGKIVSTMILSDFIAN